MAIPVRGFGLSLGMGEEVTWGTGVARTNWLRLMSHTLERTVTTVPVPHMGDHGQASTNWRFQFQQDDLVGGNIVFPMAYDDATLLVMKHIMGANVDAGGPAFTHTMTLASPPPVGLTMELLRGTHATVNTGELFSGCKFSSATWSVSTGGLLICTADIIGQTSAGLIAAATPTYSTTQEYTRFNQGGQLAWNAVNFDLQVASVNIARNLSRHMELGTLATAEPSEDRLTVTIDLEMLWRQNDMYTGFLASTQSDATLTFTGTGNNQLDLTLHNAIINTYSFNTTSAGAVTVRAQLQGYADATDQGLTAVWTNSNATAETN